jgi:hypothetical protein
VTADLDWLKRQGVEVERYNLAQQPQAFATNAAVNAALHEDGNDCLPLILVDGKIVSRGTYPDRSGLSRLAGLEVNAEEEPVKAEKTSCCSSSATVTIGGKPGRSSGSCC